ncbi:hypothetical protein FPSE_04744 [Fusarium pseudograminearum CS3096]|uniref:Uncharacterized protein n=1 Tax=Fusarium pseudograminearum (strain CS3096) TaxID=1028729 RepID=K3VJV7_FUSPC|nr:hypothetical protein FPSE_04744 [Fusarium pseudograminearum CS3096]EKJ75032.1 hypothetical protein FPSE_04744 [Fusarium pseudograminearum CS3096]
MCPSSEQEEEIKRNENGNGQSYASESAHVSMVTGRMSSILIAA